MSPHLAKLLTFHGPSTALGCCPDHHFSATCSDWGYATWELNLRKANSPTLLIRPHFNNSISHLHLLLYRERSIPNPNLIWEQHTIASSLYRNHYDGHQHRPQRGYYSPIYKMITSAFSAPFNPPLKLDWRRSKLFWSRSVCEARDVCSLWLLVFRALSRLIANLFWQNDDETLAWLVTSLILHFRKPIFGNRTNLPRHSMQIYPRL